MRKAFKFPIKDKDLKRRKWCGNRPECFEVAVKPRGVAVRDSKTSIVECFSSRKVN